MNSFVIATLIATVSAEEGYNCIPPQGQGWEFEALADETTETDKD